MVQQREAGHIVVHGRVGEHSFRAPPGAPSRILQIPQQNILITIDLSRTTLPIMSALPWEISFVRHAKSWNFKVGRPWNSQWSQRSKTPDHSGAKHSYGWQIPVWRICMQDNVNRQSAQGAVHSQQLLFGLEYYSTPNLQDLQDAIAYQPSPHTE